MKISNILLASIVASSISLSAQVDNTKKDSLATKKTCKIDTVKKASLTRKDSIKLKKIQRKAYNALKNKPKIEKISPNYCPPCGLG